MNDTTETAVRHFTVEQANATLPLLRRIVRDLLALHPAWRAAVSAFEFAQMGERALRESTPAETARIEAGRLAGEIETCLDELQQIGCIFKGFEGGLVDFPSTLDGREIYLCWRYDELRVSHWHEVDGGFDGRIALDPFNFPDDDS